MQLILRVAILAMCVLCALAMPNLGNEMVHEPSLESFKVQLLSSKIDTRAMTPAETSCADTYNNRTKKINDNMIAQINLCFDNANKTIFNNNRTENATVTLIRKDVSAVQLKLNNCNSLQDNSAFLNCITQNFNYNLNLLDSTNSQSYQVMAQRPADLSQVEMIHMGCNNAAVGVSKVQLTQCATEYNMCLDVIRQQRMSQGLNLYG